MIVAFRKYIIFNFTLKFLLFGIFAILGFGSFAQVVDTISVDQQTEQIIENISEINDGADRCASS